MDADVSNKITGLLAAADPIIRVTTSAAASRHQAEHGPLNHESERFHKDLDLCWFLIGSTHWQIGAAKPVPPVHFVSPCSAGT